MKVNLLNNFYTNNLPAQQKSNEKSENKYNAKYFSMPSDTVSFGHKSQIPAEALKSLQQEKEMLLKTYGTNYTPTLRDFHLDELEGLQNGIKIFEGLSIPQIAYLIRRLENVVIQRGCPNRCIHCYANAQTPHHMKMQKFVNQIDFEDFQNLINGFRELNNRFGFNTFRKFNRNYLTLFHDTDSSTIYLKDKAGNMYDYADLAKMLHDVTGRIVLFDTTGWNIKDTKTQKRMEDLVQKIVNSNEYNFFEFNVSINPFHSLYNRSIELAEEGKFEKAEKLREIYNNRIANAIFTFSPLLEKRNLEYDRMLNTITRALKENSQPAAYNGIALKDNNYEILDKVCELYLQDLKSGCPKVVTSEKQMDVYKDIIHSYIEDWDCRVSVVNDRLRSKISNPDSVELQNTKERLDNSTKNRTYLPYSILDINGEFYVHSYVETYPTDIVLNYKNKGKPTAPIAPNLRNEIITEDKIYKHNLYTIL